MSVNCVLWVPGSDGPDREWGIVGAYPPVHQPLRAKEKPCPAKLLDAAAQPTRGYLDTATNIPLIGPPGVGKTMLAVGLARRAGEAGHRTYFTNAADLAARCHRGAIDGRWATTMRFY